MANKIMQALDRVGALFPVEKQGLTNSVTFRHLHNYCEVVRTDTNEGLGVVGSEFGLISHRQAFEDVDGALPALEQVYGPATVEAEVYKKKRRGKGNTTEGAVVSVKAEFMEWQGEVSERGQRLYPTIHVAHGIAGDKGLEVSAGIYRLICSNGMIIGERTMRRTLRHTQNIRHKLEGLSASVVRALDETGKVRELMAQGQAIALTHTFAEEALRYVLAGRFDRGTREARNYEGILSAYYDAPGADPGNLNGVLQAATYYATHEYGRGTNPLSSETSTPANAVRQRARRLIEVATNEGGIVGAMAVLNT